MSAGAKELDESKRREIYGRFQQVVAEQVPVFFLVSFLQLQAVRDRVQNREFYPYGGGPLWKIDELRIAPK
ncbi:MAG: hypothetical protein GDA43_02035 [Hormoscilla sp. SP5CHS1]|nr:hypothetical protein [Hormoscilla sp. SP12CHS1]MBC6452112.1 hypothetical protein [Hormoscilla sp. SP5CHS1]MBC6479552.1 hypothetical protein [Hormoscilla sp. GM7CHS1pb]MBO1347231.1 hypothetical protein [Hormoscilla sp. GUM202]